MEAFPSTAGDGKNNIAAVEGEEPVKTVAGRPGADLASQEAAADLKVDQNETDDWTADFLERDDDRSRSADRKFVTALGRGLAILRVFESAGDALGNQTLARATGLPKPTVSRLTYTLTRLGYLTYSPVLGKYQLGPAALSLGHMASIAMRVPALARPIMQQFSDRVGLSVGLGTRNGLDMVLIGSCHTDNMITLRHSAGERMPMAVTAIGRAFLSSLPEEEREYLMQRLARRNRARWPEHEAAIRRAGEEIARNGFCSSMGEWMSDISGVAVPLQLREGLFALNCGGPGFRIDRERLVREIGPELVMVARDIRHVAGQ